MKRSRLAASMRHVISADLTTGTAIEIAVGSLGTNPDIMSSTDAAEYDARLERLFLDYKRAVALVNVWTLKRRLEESAPPLASCPVGFCADDDVRLNGDTLPQAISGRNVRLRYDR